MVPPGKLTMLLAEVMLTNARTSKMKRTTLMAWRVSKFLSCNRGYSLRDLVRIEIEILLQGNSELQALVPVRSSQVPVALLVVWISVRVDVVRY